MSMYVYEHKKLNQEKEGNSLQIDDDLRKLPDSMDQKISSFLIDDDRVWFMWDKEDYQGTRWGPFTRGVYSLEDDFFKNDDITSIRAFEVKDYESWNETRKEAEESFDADQKKARDQMLTSTAYNELVTNSPEGSEIRKAVNGSAIDQGLEALGLTRQGIPRVIASLLKFIGMVLLIFLGFLFLKRMWKAGKVPVIPEIVKEVKS